MDRVPPGLRAALPAWLVARAAVALGFLVAVVVSDKLLPGPTLQLEQGLFAWDAAFYRDIAEAGYDRVAPDGLRFFPLVPALAALVAVPLLGNVGAALVIVSNAAALAAGVLVHRLARLDHHDRALADRATWLLALLPPAMVLVLGYAESTMMALGLAAFLALRRRRWWWAALFGCLAGLSRPIGGLLAVPALVEALRDVRSAPPGERAARLGAVAGPVVGVGSFLLWVELTFGDWRLPLEMQAVDDLRGGWVNPVARVIDLVASLGDDPLGESLHLPWVVLFIGLVAVLFVRWPASYGAFAAALLLVALASDNLGSFERYGLSAFPLLLGLATVTDHPLVDRMAVTASAAGLCAFTAMAALGTFVP